MEKAGFSAKAEIFLSCATERHTIKELVLNDHALFIMLSGESRIVHANQAYVFRAGDIILCPRNQLARVTKCPVDGQPCRSISIVFTQTFLQKYYAAHPIVPAPSADTPRIKAYGPHPLLESLLSSLLPYFTFSAELPTDLAAIKVQEAITVLRAIDKEADSILGNFEKPGKIDLASFMEKNYMFNMSLERFGFLTGRSLTTFKRDFKKAFNTNPQTWLKQKRLETAYYEIFEKKRKPIDVYFEVGFENLSHFSFAFKQKYGLSPKQLAKAHTG